MAKYISQLIIVAIALSCSSPLYAGTWMRSEGEAYYSGGLTYETSDSYWDNTMHRVPSSCQTKNWDLSHSYEYGWSYYRTLFGSVDLRDRNCGDAHSGSSGIGDVQLGMRGRLDLYRNGRTWETSVIIPTGYSTTGTSRLGNGLYGLVLGLYGRFLNKDSDEEASTPTLELGSNITIWQGKASEQLHAYTKMTLPVFYHFSVYGMGSADFALTDRSATYDPNTNAYRSYGYDKITGRIGATAKLGSFWRVSLETSNVLWGRNAGDTTTYGLYISRNFKD